MTAHEALEMGFPRASGDRPASICGVVIAKVVPPRKRG